MQKIYLKPTTQEICIKEGSKGGHTDVFAYDYHEDEDKRNLGALYIVGNVGNRMIAEHDLTVESEDKSDITYVTNLIASLAKREYYSKPNPLPRDAFSATLRKINDVVEEFFNNQSLEINIGIFAIAGENIMISKLGKFKIILARSASPTGGSARLPARTGANKDSRIIDILNNIDLFSKEQVKEKKFSSIVSGKIVAGDKLFAFYPNRMITAREKTIRASLLKDEAKQFIEKINSIKETKPDFDCGALYISMDNHKESGRSHVERPGTQPAQTSEVVSSLSSVPLGTAAQHDSVQLRQRDDGTGNGSTQWQYRQRDDQYRHGDDEAQRIITSEFSLGRKVNPLLASIMTPFNAIKKLLRDKNIKQSPIPSNKDAMKRKLILLSLVVGVLALGIILTKIFVVISPEKRQLNIVVNQAQNNLKLARAKISQNDLIGARLLFVESLSSIYDSGTTNDKIQKITEEIYEILNTLDKAVDVSPSLLEEMPKELSKKIEILNTYQDRGVSLDVYANNLYILTRDNILKILDIDKINPQAPSSWLESGTLPPHPTTLAVDGNIYVINSSGTLATYYKGEKVSETNTLIVSSEGDVLLTSTDSDKLYLVNKKLARIYELDKESKTLIRTLKVGSSEPFVDAYLLGDSTIIITTKDGRIWEIK